ncbi:chaplin [Streptomyces bambusae]|uniref:DUF320 domain-containing protein n=1 Tax=Streptomyces bambusae TaxID=1550616 RepID=A0ABS6ZGC9_9ACTN|nr:chaplin [Streptomyces bambusae]MBW5486807.1 DUF320 domain-containing protein [Streptomyces bambusae]
MRQVLSRQVLGKGVLTAAAASSLLSIAGGVAYANHGAVAEASHSPGVLAGNSVSVPITLSPNVCGNSVDGGAALNPAFGNTCVNDTGHGGGHTSGGHASGGYGDDDGPDYARYLSPEHAETFQRYLEEREYGHPHAPRHAKPRHEAPEEAPVAIPRAREPRHAAPHEPREQVRHEPRRQGGHSAAPEEECDDHPAPRPDHAPPAPKPKPKPQHKPQPKPQAEHPAPHPAPPAPKPLSPLHICRFRRTYTC